MVLTIGIMVGFIFGFILFLSRLPDEHYTLVETERGIEQIEAAEADQYAFYDRLSETRSSVPNAEANEMPAFSRERSAGKYGAGVNERPSAVKIADEFSVGADVKSIEIAAAAGGTISGGAAGSSLQREGSSVVIRQPAIKSDKPATFYYLQAGAFAERGDADRLRRRLNQSGIDAFVNQAAIEGKQWHRVRLGPFYDSQSLNSAQTRLGRSGISYLVVKVQKS